MLHGAARIACLTVVVLLGCAVPATACSCVGTDQGHGDCTSPIADVIVRATVVSTITPGGTRMIELEVSEAFHCSAGSSIMIP
jgi:hypothetical protein